MRKHVITEKANAARRIATILSEGTPASKTVNGVRVLSFTHNDDEYDVWVDGERLQISRLKRTQFMTALGDYLAAGD